MDFNIRLPNHFRSNDLHVQNEHPERWYRGKWYKRIQNKTFSHFSTNFVPHKQYNNNSKIERIECSNNKRFCNESICDVKFVSRDTSLINVGCNLVKSVKKVNVRMTLHYRNLVYQKFLIDVTEDYCGFQNGIDTQKMLHVFMPHVYPYAPSLKGKCPFIGNMTVIGLPYGKYLFPHFLPAGQYRLDIDITTRNITIWFLQVFFAISSTGLQELPMGK